MHVNISVQIVWFKESSASLLNVSALMIRLINSAAHFSNSCSLSSEAFNQVRSLLQQCQGNVSRFSTHVASHGSKVCVASGASIQTSSQISPSQHHLLKTQRASLFCPSACVYSPSSKSITLSSPVIVSSRFVILTNSSSLMEKTLRCRRLRERQFLEFELQTNLRESTLSPCHVLRSWVFPRQSHTERERAQNRKSITHA